MKLLSRIQRLSLNEKEQDMSKELFWLADFFVGDDLCGGAELSDEAIIERLELPVTKLRYNQLDSQIKKDRFYIVSNRSLFSPFDLKKLEKYKNYIVIEHDYQFVVGPGNGRNPYLFPDAVVPSVWQGHLDFYKNAKAVFFQTAFQKHLFEVNKVEGNFISMSTTPYSIEDFKFFRKMLEYREQPTTRKFAIVDSEKDIKNTEGAVKYCEMNKLDYELIPSMERVDFLRKLAEYPALVFLPKTPESCCRLVTEARILGLNVITPPTYGAPHEEWFKLSGVSLVDELERITLEESLPTIKQYISRGIK